MSRDVERIIPGDIQHRLILNEMADAIHLVDRKFVIIWANDVYLNWLVKMGIDPDIVGKTVREATPFLSEIVFGEYYQALLGETVVTNEVTTLPSGETIDTETRKIPIIADGEVGGVLTIIRDVTAYNLSMKALAESENRFRRFMENIDLIAVSLDLEGNIVFCNDHVLSLCGRMGEDVVGQNWFELFLPADDVRATVRAYHESLTDGGGVPNHFENQIITKDGHIIDVAWSNAILHDVSGVIIGTASIGEDITDRKMVNDLLVESEARYRLLSEQLETSNNDLTEYSHVVSHELRNPLGSIGRMAKIVHGDVHTDKITDSTLTLLDQILEKAQWATTMIDEVLRYSEIGNSEVLVTAIPCSDVLSDVIEDVKLIGPVDIKLKDTWPIVRGDPALIHQIFRNLIENGIKFNESNPKRVELSWEMDQLGNIVVSVTDNGLGIPPELLGRVFEPHMRYGDHGGSGMGLAIVKRACGRLGVPVSVESEVGKGTTFRLVFRPGSIALHDESISQNT